MRIWNQVPLFRLLLPFMAGILIEIFYPLNIQIILSLFVLSLPVLIAFTLLKKLYRKWNIRWIYGLTLNVTLLFSGIIITHLNTDDYLTNHFSKSGKATLFVAMLEDQLHEKKNTFKTKVNIQSIKLENGKWKNVRGHVLVYLKKDSTAAQLKYGDMIIFSLSPAPTEPPKNPEEFNYKRFLSFHNIYHQVYLPGDKWINLKRNYGNSIFEYAFELRDHLVSIFRTYISGEREFAVASALVLGYEDSIDAELINAYASAGALHVLSVSGMHVGVTIYVLQQSSF